MPTDTPGELREMVLGPGFLGGWQRPVGLIAAEVVTHSALTTPDGGVMDRLRALSGRLRPGGVVAGFLSYEVSAEREPSIAFPPPPDGLPAAWIGLFEGSEAVAAPCGEGSPGGDGIAGEEPAAYRDKVSVIVSSILAGDLFQANLSRRLSATFAAGEGLDAALFAVLCRRTDAPYSALLSLEGGAVLSASPELFLRVDGRDVLAEPIKGTRPRGKDTEEDEAFAAELLACEKDRAENVMIADLMRNDLSRVAEDGSVSMAAVCALRSMPRVHHLYSQVTARLREGFGPVDALEACYPCGSITGAPKPAAMATIARLEGEGRGPYCGTVFAIPRDGPAVFSVAIRTGVLTRQGETARLDVRTGGGVTVMSDPAAEWAETEDKAYPFRLMMGGT